jgi:hypothetical protein
MPSQSRKRARASNDIPSSPPPQRRRHAGSGSSEDSADDNVASYAPIAISMARIKGLKAQLDVRPAGGNIKGMEALSVLMESILEVANTAVECAQENDDLKERLSELEDKVAEVNEEVRAREARLEGLITPITAQTGLIDKFDELWEFAKRDMSPSGKFIPLRKQQEWGTDSIFDKVQCAVASQDHCFVQRTWCQ